MAAIIVIGGGVAGLACAWRLQNAGHDVEVLDRAEDAWGAFASEVHNGFLIERGLSAFGPGDQHLRSLAEKLGLAAQMQVIEPGGRAILRRGVFESLGHAELGSLLRSPLLSARAKLRSARFALTLARQRARLSLDHPEAASLLEEEDAATDLVREVGLEARDFLLGPLARSEMGAPIEELSDAAARLVLRHRVGGAPFMALDGGMGQLSAALGQSLSLRTRCEVEEVVSTEGGVRVSYRSGARRGRAYADAAVLAVAPVQTLEMGASLRASERAFFEAAPSLRSAVVHLLFDEWPRSVPLPAAYALELPAVLGLDVRSVRVEHAKHFGAPPGGGALRVELSAHIAARSFRRDEARVVQRALDALARTPLGLLQPTRSLVRWREHAATLFSPGHLRRLSAFQARAERSPRLAFATDALYGPNAEGALRAGLAAAREVVRSLGTQRKLARGAAARRAGTSAPVLSRLAGPSPPPSS